jgi:hypothetical protein
MKPNFISYSQQSIDAASLVIVEPDDLSKGMMSSYFICKFYHRDFGLSG